MLWRVRRSIASLLALALASCGVTVRGVGDGGSGGGGSTSSVTSTTSIAASSSTGETPTPESCDATPVDACTLDVGCMIAKGYRFPVASPVCNEPISSCDDAEPIARCVFAGWPSGGWMQAVDRARLSGDQVEVVRFSFIPFGGFPLWTYPCAEPIDCPGLGPNF